MSHFTLDGVGLEYTWWGTAARGARQVLLVHGALRSAWTWDWLGPSLAAALKTRVVAISRYGHGRSDAPPALAPDARFFHEANELLPAFRKAVALDDVVLVGEAEGAAVGRGFQDRRAPCRLDRFVGALLREHCRRRRADGAGNCYRSNCPAHPMPLRPQRSAHSFRATEHHRAAADKGR